MNITASPNVLMLSIIVPAYYYTHNVIFMILSICYNFVY